MGASGLGGSVPRGVSSNLGLLPPGPPPWPRAMLSVPVCGCVHGACVGRGGRVCPPPPKLLDPQR